MIKKRTWVFRGFALLALVLLLGWALSNAPLAQIRATLSQLHIWQLVALLLLNMLIYLLITLRWWIIVRSQTRQVPFWPLLAVRVAVFGVSYFTLGPQVGGEPLQVLALQQRYALTASRATASVLMDKLLEFLANFLLLALGLAAVLQAGLPVGLLAGNGFRLVISLVLLVVLACWPILHILLMYNHIHPITLIVRALPKGLAHSQAARFIRACEWLAGTFCRQHPRALLGSLCVSLLVGAAMLLDYSLMLNFLGIHLPFWSAVTGWLAGWLSFLVPLPGGLGSLEASQVFALGIFGVPAAAAIGLTLLTRARDLLIGGFGLLLAGNDISRVK